MKFKFFLFFLCCVFHAVFAQQDAWVYFTDKENIEVSIQNPISILSQKAIDIKKMHNIAIDARDVPVTESYMALIVATEGITVMAKSKWMNAAHVRGEETAIARLFDFNFVSSIDFADKNLTDLMRPIDLNDKFKVEASLEDFKYGSAQNQVTMIHVDALHLENYTGKGMTIAVIDAGFPNVNTMSSFSRLRANNGLLGGYDFVNRTSDIYNPAGDSHGTKVLSTMAGFIENKYVGTAPDASYYLFRTENAAIENPVEESYWVEAAELADSLGVHIINSSLGYSDFDNTNYNYIPSDMDGNTTFISRGATIASQKGILVVNAAGNSGGDSWGIVTAPADASGVLTVGAVKADGTYASFSSRGNAFQPTLKPDVVAQGSEAAVIDQNDVMINNNGTSFSSPLMAGGVACLWQALPNASADEIKQFVRLSSSQYQAPNYFLGYGIPNLELAQVLGLSMSDENGPDFKVFPNPVSNQLHVQLTSTTEKYLLNIYDMMGKKVTELLYFNTSSIVDVSHLISGIYVLSIVSKSRTFNFKFIKS